MNNEVFDHMKVNKDSLKNIIKDNNIINILHDAIFRVNKIIYLYLVDFQYIDYF